MADRPQNPRVILRRKARPLRPDQQIVVDAFAAWRSALLPAAGPGPDDERWAYIVLPPRTGKTVIAARIVEQAALHAIFVVPTRVLVHQTRREFARHAPGVRVGTWFGEEKGTVPRGINITTYTSLLLHRQSWGPDLASARLVFCDEAHHALTPSRVAALREAFPPDALRVALTATPDYDARRRLKTVFPRQIASMELRDALEGGLLAPSTVRVAEVDVDGSEVEIVAGDYRPDQLARILSHAPFLYAALTFRYRASYAPIPAMIACVSRQQAADLVRHFERYKPATAPSVALILGETPADERSRILRDFESGRIDTIVQVGVLIEGWTSRRCKLLIDLAPGRSRVRATQKYFRVLTRDGDAVATILVLLPRNLERPPVLPMDLLLDPGDVYVCGRTIGGHGPRKPLSRDESPVQGVRLVQRVVVSAPLGVPRLDRDRLDDVRAVVASTHGFNPYQPPGRTAFESLYVSHQLFSGTGRMLLRWLKVAPTAYDDWLCTLFPQQTAIRLLGEEDVEAPLLSMTRWSDGTGVDEGEPAMADEALRDLVDESVPPDETAILAQRCHRMHSAFLDVLTEAERFILTRHFGLDGDEEETFTDIAAVMERSKERVRQQALRAFEKLRVQSAILDDHFEASLSTGNAPLVKPPWPVLERNDGADWSLSALTRFVDADPKFLGAWKCLFEIAIRIGQRDLIESVLARLPSDVDDRTLCSIGSILAANVGPCRAFDLYMTRGREDWWIASTLIRGGDTRWVLEWYEQMKSWSAPDAYLVALARLRLGQPYGAALLFALGLDRTLKHHPIQGRSVFFEGTRDLWQDPPGALPTVAQWTESPLVRRWIRGLWRNGADMDRWVWSRRSEIALEVEKTLGADRGLPLDSAEGSR